MPEVSVIIVSYQAKDLLDECLNSLFPALDTSYEIIIVENNGGDDLTELEESFASVRVVYNDTNAGFGGGCNLGAQQAQGDYLFFLNPDTEIQTGTISTILSRMKDHTRIGTVGLTLLNEEYDIQPHQYGDILTPKNLISQNFAFPKSAFPSTNYTIWKPVDWNSGGAFICDKHTFETIGGFDEDFFLYMEDIDLGKRLKEAGYQSYWTNLIHVFHHEGGTQGPSLSTKRHY